MRVFVSDIIVKKDKDGYDYYWVVGRLQSGVEVIIENPYFDFRECIGRHVEMLISFMRSPYCELERGIQNQIFLSSKYYSVELIDELLSQNGVVSTGNERVIVLTGELIDSYVIPEKWVSLTQRKLFQLLYKKPSALRTEDGTFLLYPFHLRKRVPTEQIPLKVTMAGGLNLEAWTPIQ
ncbi:MAG: hypothetical protein KGD74_11280 [Candidatus Lokiarchaeota archaeon]|nr:hypothetical protein [Candidatus Lokiarchaeota archaeon]